MRARDIGLFAASGRTGALNAIVDVPGVAVGHVTRIAGDGPLVVGEGPVRTGVTVVVPRAEPVALNPVFAGIGRLNGNGEMTGSHWIEESGLLTSPIALTNTHSVGVVRDALVQVERSQRSGSDWWSLPVVAETWDGLLNDINGSHVLAADVWAALEAAGASGAGRAATAAGAGPVAAGPAGVRGPAGGAGPAAVRPGAGPGPAGGGLGRWVRSPGGRCGWCGWCGGLWCNRCGQRGGAGGAGGAAVQAVRARWEGTSAAAPHDLPRLQGWHRHLVPNRWRVAGDTGGEAWATRPAEWGSYTVGVLGAANHGSRRGGDHGFPVGRIPSTRAWSRCRAATARGGWG